MAETHKPPEQFTLRMRRYDPESGEAPYWDEHTVELEPHRSVLEGILQAKAASTARSASAAPAGPRSAAPAACKINGEPGLACHTHLDHARGVRRRRRDRDRADGQHAGDQGPDRGHGRRALEEGPARHAVADGQAAGARARVHRAERVDGRRHPVDGLHPVRRVRVGLPGDGGRPGLHRPGRAGQGLPVRRRPARRPSSDERLQDLAEDPQGIYDCTHCFKCVEACPKDVNPMGQIMRLRRIASSDQHIVDRNNGERHEAAFIDADQGQRAAARGRAAARAPTAATRGSANSTRPPAKSCSARCRRV